MITIVLPISRRDYLKPVFDCLATLDKPEDTELLIITDGDKELEAAVDRRLDSISYSRIQVISFGNTPVEDRNSRRFRISAIHNKAKEYVSDQSTYVFLVEDDTTYPADCLTKMLGFFDYVEDCAFVQGVQLGRRKTPYVGAWIADDIKNPHIIKSPLPDFDADELELLAMKRPVMQRIDAGGFYCALTKAELYKSHNFEPYDKQGTNGLSCDVNYGLWLRNQGFECFMDWSIRCDHIGERGAVNLGNATPVSVTFRHYNNRWVGRVE